jgi:hypothetical protein
MAEHKFRWLKRDMYEAIRGRQLAKADRPSRNVVGALDPHPNRSIIGAGYDVS